jgi:hypothetical protein
MNKEEFIQQFVCNYTADYMVNRTTTGFVVPSDLTDKAIDMAKHVWRSLENTKHSHKRTSPVTGEEMDMFGWAN